MEKINNVDTNSPKNKTDSVVIEGIYEKTLFRNEKSGYTIFSLNVDENIEHRNHYGNITCSAKSPIYAKGMPLKLIGKWNFNKYGILLEIDKIEEYVDDKEISISYLSTNLCKGIGRKTAELIVDKFGSNIFEFIQKENAVDLLKQEIRGMNEEKAQKLVSSIKSTISQRQIFEYISRFGGTYSAAMKIAEEYGMYSLQRLKENPYKVGSFAGIDFYICDAIAKECNIKPLDEKRINALIYEGMQMVTSKGHTYTTQRELLYYINLIIKNSAYLEKIPSAIILNVITKSKWIVIEKDHNDSAFRIFPKDLWQAETKTVSEINRLCQNETLNFNENIVNKIEKKLDIKYETKQKEAFNILRTTGIKIITGGPGTGKTTTINGIIEAYKILNPYSEVVLCAPTGRAAQRLKESTGHEAFTIHKLLEYKPFGKEISHKDANNPIDANFIIVDEFSMIDIKIMSIFLSAVKNHTLICFVGDTAQLPSVEAGNVMHDLIKSKKVDVFMLDAIFRQNETSNIIINANKIKNGQTDLVTGDDFEIYHLENEIDVLTQLQCISEEIDYTDKFATQILSSTKKHEIGTYSLNKNMQSLINDSSKKMVFGNNVFRENDKIIMTQNNYTSGYYNGDIGTIIEICDDCLKLLINEEIVTLTRKDYTDINLAYAITIHKSQGSEFPVVIIVLPKRPRNMLERNLIFTAITRAKDKVIILTENNALEQSIIINNLTHRKTRLYERLIDINIDLIPQRKNTVFHL